jgi:hypothetical protein
LSDAVAEARVAVDVPLLELLALAVDVTLVTMFPPAAAMV